MYFIGMAKNGFLIIAALALVTAGCVFQDEDPSLEYARPFAEVLDYSKPSIEVDEAGNIHILANVRLLYAKEGADFDSSDIKTRGVTTRHFKIDGAGITRHSFQNLLGYHRRPFLFGHSTYSENLYAAIRDLDKYILYIWESGHWKKVRSAFTRIDYNHHFDFFNLVVGKGDIWISFYTEYPWYFSGLQINDKRIINRHRPESLADLHNFSSSTPVFIGDTYYMTGTLGLDDPDRHSLYLFRAGKDSIQQEFIRGDKNYMSGTIALVNDSARLFVSNEDSLYRYDIGQTPAALLRVSPVEQDSQIKGYPVEYKIDQKGCYHALNYDHGRSLDSLGDIISRTEELSYLLQCSEPTPKQDILPESPEGFRYSREISFALDPEGGIHIAAWMFEGRPDADAPREVWQEYWKRKRSDRLYHIFKKDGNWIFQLVNLK
jgi:hypothetical protein